MEFEKLRIGGEYGHVVHGRSVFVAPHPHDGAYLIMAYNDEEADEERYFGCVREELTEI